MLCVLPHGSVIEPGFKLLLEPRRGLQQLLRLGYHSGAEIKENSCTRGIGRLRPPMRLEPQIQYGNFGANSCPMC
jgi:hypothetical protein